MENTGPRGDRGIFFDHESYLSNITNKVAVIVPRRGSMEVNFQLCGNKTHFTMLHTPNRISPIASPSGDTIRMQRLIIQKMFRAISSGKRYGELTVCFCQCK